MKTAILLLAVLIAAALPALAQTEDAVIPPAPAAKKRLFGIRLCASITYNSSGNGSAKLLEFHKGDFYGTTPWPAFVFGKGFITPAEGERRRGAIWEVRLPMYQQSQNDNASTSSNTLGQSGSSNSWSLSNYLSWRQIVPLKLRRMQLFAGLTARSVNSKSAYSNSYFDDNGLSSTGENSTSAFSAELNPVVGFIFQPHPRLCLDITFSRFLGTQMASYYFNQTTRTSSSAPQNGDPYPSQTSTQTLRNFNTIGTYTLTTYPRVKLISDLQFGLTYLF